MDSINGGAQNVEQLNEAFEMTKLRKRYKKYIKLMQDMLKQFKEDEHGVNIVKTFGMNSGFTNAISAFFGFGKNAENRQTDVYIGVKPFAMNVCRLINDNYKKSKAQFDSLVKNSNIKDSTSNAKIVNAATSIMYEFFSEYMNADKLLKQGGIDITANSTMNSKTFKSYSSLINTYNPKNVGNNVQLFEKLSASYTTMVQKFDTLGQRLVANFTKYFNKQMQEAGKDDEKIANALEGTQAKLSASWKAQTDLIKSNFPAVVQTILASPEYSEYYEFIIKEVLPKVQECITGPTQQIQQNPDDIIRADSQKAGAEGNAQSGETAAAENTKIPGYGITAEELDAFVFDIPRNVSASEDAPYEEDSDLSEAKAKGVKPAQSQDSYVKASGKTSSSLYKMINISVKAVCEQFRSLGVTLEQREEDCPTVHELSNAQALDGVKAGNIITKMAEMIKRALSGGKQNNSQPEPVPAPVNPTPAPAAPAAPAAASEDEPAVAAAESFSPKLEDNITGVFETADGICMYMNHLMDLNENASDKTYVFTSHCWGNGTYINPGESLMLGIKKIINESSTIGDIMKAVKNSKNISLNEYREQIELDTYGKSDGAFTKWNPMYVATALITENMDAITSVKYLGSKKIVLY